MGGSARGGLAARLGDDELSVAVLLAPTVTLREVAALRQPLAQPVDHAGQTLTPTVSIGTAPAADASRLLRGADLAMYRVKTGEKPAYPPTVHKRCPGRPPRHAPAPRMTRRTHSGVLDCKDAQHFDRWQSLPACCATRRRRCAPTTASPSAKSALAQHPVEARRGRFASGVQPKRQSDDDHA
ncbi:diguanylate cyclase domain-containing protein [Streptomyces sp. NPDC002755]|uniref:diguanylate cyclase domain-containing protein n=1 Tax=Streptomyces sp. NPDC002884 TaxID=3154544 RepID=UPI00331C6F5D